jgi:hypothetical protein
MAREYDEYLRQKVERGRADILAGRTTSNEVVKAESAQRRAEFLARTLSGLNGPMSRGFLSRGPV